MAQNTQKAFQVFTMMRAGIEMHESGTKHGSEQCSFMNEAYQRHMDLVRQGQGPGIAQVIAYTEALPADSWLPRFPDFAGFTKELAMQKKGLAPGTEGQPGAGHRGKHRWEAEGRGKHGMFGGR
jgi:hypothetical protein